MNEYALNDAIIRTPLIFSSMFEHVSRHASVPRLPLPVCMHIRLYLRVLVVLSSFGCADHHLVKPILTKMPKRARNDVEPPVPEVPPEPEPEAGPSNSKQRRYVFEGFV